MRARVSTIILQYRKDARVLEGCIIIMVLAMNLDFKEGWFSLPRRLGMSFKIEKPIEQEASEEDDVKISEREISEYFLYD